MNREEQITAALTAMREVLENLNALKGEKYVKYVLLWSKFRTTQSLMVMAHTPSHVTDAVVELICELFASILAAHEREVGKEFNLDELDKDARTLVGNGLHPLGLDLKP